MKYTLIPGQPHTASEEETMSIIRSILTDEGDAGSVPLRHADGTDSSAHDDETAAFVERTPPPSPRRRATDFPELAQDAHVEQRPGILHELWSTISRTRRFEPKTRHLALACAALLFVLRPHWFAIASVFVIFVICTTFLTLGADRVWAFVLNWLDRIERKDSARAEEMRAKLDMFAYRWDSILDVLPDGMASGLYMPDFQSLQMAEAEHQEVVAERLGRMARET